jgi:alkylation response protein AidB-like acyl-CoA dehydrogenase
MNFDDSPDEAAFRAEVRAFLEQAAAPYQQPPAIPRSEDEIVEGVKAWQATKAKGGFAAILWPTEMGGRGGAPMQQVIFNEEESRYHVPQATFIVIGLGMAIPTIRAHGTAEQLARFARPTFEGKLAWCQLFSEPAAGTDLAGLRTRAVRDGDGWIVNGQKVWTSWAHRADYGILVARTDPSVVKHRGLTYFILDMKAPGVEARPIRQMSGRAEFNEVFLTDVRIPDSMRVGGVGEGWKVAMTTLMNERFGTGGGPGNVPKVADLIALARATGKLANPAVRQQIARLCVEEQGLQYFRYRVLTKLSRGETPGQESAIIKLSFAKHLQELTSFAIDLEGEAGMLSPDDNPRLAAVQNIFLRSAALRIAGGTDEVLRNLIAERMLGMPADTRLDKDLPFDQLPAGRR